MKVVYGEMYFALEAVAEVPWQVSEAYQAAVERVPGAFRHNVVKASSDLRAVTLLWYPHLETHAHPCLEEGVLVPLDERRGLKYKMESRLNPVILHRLETMLSRSNPRRAHLAALTASEEAAGLFSKAEARFIGRRRYWNRRCRELGLVESLAPEAAPSYAEQELFPLTSALVRVKRQATAMAATRPSAPTRWAFERGLIRPVVFDWGCGRGRDSLWLEGRGVQVLSYDPFYKPCPQPVDVDFNPVRTVLLNYVLNVVETPEERRRVMEDLQRLSRQGTTAIVSARGRGEVDGNAARSGWKVMGDGYLTGRGTFQKGFTASELADFCRQYARVVETAEIGRSVVCALSIAK